jgi:hypothetical protein
MCCGLQRKAHFFYILEFLWILVLFVLALTSVIVTNSNCMSNKDSSYGIFVILLIYLVYTSCYLVYSFSYCAVIFTDYAKKRREVYRAQEDPGQSKGKKCINTCCFGIFYGLLKVFRAIIIFIKFFDFTQLFQWCIKSYLIINLIEFALETLMYVFLLSINIASTIVFQQNGCNSFYPIQIACLIWLTIKYFFTCFYFIYFTLYRPSFLDKEGEKPAKEHARFMRLRELGISLCHSGDYCLSIDLQHILRNHNKLNIPTKKCNPWYYCAGKENYLIGFHQTTADAALKIACTGFRPGSDGMFGGGIYFARSIDHTFGKAHFTGAFICALIDMGRMKTVTKGDRTITLQKLNREGFDSVYAKAGGDLSRDEFIVYSSDRVKKWIICIP